MYLGARCVSGGRCVRGRSHLHYAAGPAAIAAYLEDPLESRLVMSPKSYLASRNFTSTNLLGRIWTLEQLIGSFLRALLAAGALDPAGLHVVAGRPVRFAGGHRLSMMRTPRMMRDIADVRRTAEDPERLDHLRPLIEDEQGCELYRAVSEAKAALSSAESAVLSFAHGEFVLDRVIGRKEF